MKMYIILISRMAEWRNHMDTTRLRDAGIKTTFPRLRFLTSFISTRIFVGAADIYRNLLSERSNISLATVYRVITQRRRRAAQTNAA